MGIELIIVLVIVIIGVLFGHSTRKHIKPVSSFTPKSAKRRSGISIRTIEDVKPEKVLKPKKPSWSKNKAKVSFNPNVRRRTVYESVPTEKTSGDGVISDVVEKISLKPKPVTMKD